MKCCAMPTSSSNLLALAMLSAVASTPLSARKPPKPDPAFVATAPVVELPKATDGAIFSAQGYSPLTSGNRAAKVGDLVMIQLVERTSANKSNSANTGRDGSIGLTPPTTGPLDFISPTDINFSGNQSFKGKGDAAQSNNLSGELSVTVAEVYPNGTMLVRGEKLLTLNRGDERVQVSGIIRIDDISPDNRILSSRVADARINYVGKGEIARASQQGWLQKFFSIISPF
jgi:flagellar L-ring protein FlgH